MNRNHVKYLIIGGGIAGSAAVEAIRRRDSNGSILFVGQETNRPYLRPELNKRYLRRPRGQEYDRASLALLPTDWYADRKVELRTALRVNRLDTARFAVTLSSGEEMSFDSALIATGASAAPLKIAGAELPGLHTLRTLDDADRLLHALDTVRTTRTPRVVIIGGGMLGVETAATLSQVGVAVQLVETAGHLWPRIAGPAFGSIVERWLINRGVSVATRSAATRSEGDGRVQRVICGGGQAHACDLAIAAVGTTIGRELLRGTPIAAETAILVDTRCQTNVPGIYAAGDCTAIHDPLFGKHRVIDYLDHARLSGDIAGSNMAGGDERYAQLNHYWGELFDRRFDVWGESKLAYRHVTRGDPASDDFAEFAVAADDRIAQVIVTGRDTERSALRYCVEKRLNAGQWEKVLSDSSSDLCQVM